MRNRVSVITTVKNEADNIGFLIDSILKQNYKFYEFIINDNNSTDNTVKIIEKYTVLDERIKVVKSGNLNIGEGRNVAIECSTGDILALIDSGIAPSTEWLENVVAPLIKDESLDLSWGHVIFDTKSRIIESTDIALALVFLTKYREDRVDAENVTSSAIRRRVWEEMNGFPTIDLPIEDLLLIDKIKRYKYKTIHSPNAKVYYFRFPETLFEVYKKWKHSSYCAVIVKQSERGFKRQLSVFGSFFVLMLLAFIEPRVLFAVVLYISIYFGIKYYNNKVLAKKIFGSPSLLMLTFALFNLLNIARLIGAGEAFLSPVKKQMTKKGG